VFTGPPYFDYEIYGDGTNQSCTTFPDPVDWIVNFLFYCIHISWQLLNPGGTLALNVNDTYQLVHKRVLYTEAMNLFIQAFFDCTYDGVICFTGANYPAPQPIWLYRKITSQNKTISQQCLLLVRLLKCKLMFGSFSHKNTQQCRDIVYFHIKLINHI